MLVFSGGGVQPYWFLKEPKTGEGIARAEKVMMALHKRLQSDEGVHDASRILRIPGMLNHKKKYGEPRRVRLLHLDKETLYTLDELEEMIPEGFDASSNPDCSWNGVEGLNPDEFSEQEIIVDGERNTKLWKRAAGLFRQGYVRAEVLATIEAMNANGRVQPPMGSKPDDESIESIVESAARGGRNPFFQSNGGTPANSANGANGSSHANTETPGFPIEVMPVMTRRFIRETAAAIDCPVDFVGVPVLGALSASIGQSREAVRSSTHKQSAALYLASLGGPGSGKSPAMSAAVDPVKKHQQELKRDYEAEKELYEDKRRAYEADKKQAANDGHPAPRPPEKPTFPRTWVDDTTIEAMAKRLDENPRGLYLMQDELAGWMKGFDQYKSGGKGNTRQKYLQIWSNETISVDRVGNDEPTIVEHPFVTIYGGIQPRLLGEIADGRDDGFLDRFLVSYPEPHVSYENDNEVSYEAEESYNELIRRLYKGETPPKPVHITKAAKDLLKFHSHRISDEQKYGDMSEGLKNAWSKMRAYLIRISLIMAVCRVAENDPGEDEKITAKDVENAAALVEYFKGMARKAYGQINSSDTTSKVAFELISLLRERSVIKASADELRQMLPSSPETPEATSRLVQNIAKTHPFIDFERGWKHDSRIIRLRLIEEEPVGTVGSVGEDPALDDHTTPGVPGVSDSATHSNTSKQQSPAIGATVTPDAPVALEEESIVHERAVEGKAPAEVAPSLEDAGVSHTLEGLECLLKEKPKYSNERDPEVLIDAVAALPDTFFVPTREEMIEAMKTKGLEPDTTAIPPAPQGNTRSAASKKNEPSEIEITMRRIQRAPRNGRSLNRVQVWVINRGKVGVYPHPDVPLTVGQVCRELQWEGYFSYTPPEDEVERVLKEMIKEVNRAKRRHNRRQKEDGTRR
jgi:hypothetical protein